MALQIYSQKVSEFMLYVKYFVVDAEGVIIGAEIVDKKSGQARFGWKSDFHQLRDKPIENAYLRVDDVLCSKKGYDILRINEDDWKTQLSRQASINTSPPPKVTGYLKWHNTIIGEVLNTREVRFTPYKLTDEAAQHVVSVITKDADWWSEAEYVSFLTDRVVCKSRRDIEKILFRLGLIEYDAVKIAEKTGALNPKDLFWITPDKNARMDSVIGDTFKNIFKMKLDIGGSTNSSPDGQNIKSYGIYNGGYGIFKRRLSDVVTDAESEVANYKIAQLLGVQVCPATFVDKDTVFSLFKYNFTNEYLVHARHFFADGERTGDQYHDLVSKFPEFKLDIAQMCLFDFVMRQDDRHLSNLAILIGERRSFYPLYDNGRSLFFDCGEDLVSECLKDVMLYATTFGEIGTYYDAVQDIAKDFKVAELINLNVSESEILSLLQESGFKGYRLEGSLKWIMQCLGELRKL